jgi:HepT-like protein
VWDKLRKQIAVEREQLHQLLKTYRPILEKCAASPPSEIEISGLAALLNSFYNGVENIFKRVSVELGDPLPEGESWHKELLDGMAEATSRRKAAISGALRGRLKEYMEFRHFFRHAYIFTLRWDRIRPLVLGCEETLRQLELELDSFLHGAA